MTDQDRDAFLATYAGIQEFYGRDPSPTVAAMWWDLARSEITMTEFQQAAMIHMRSCKFPPQLSEILDIIRCAAWPQPEAAWNMAPKSDADTAWMCQEIAEALAACQDSIDRGDLIGARKAFLEAYSAKLKTVRGTPQWWISEASSGDYTQRLEAKAALLQHRPHQRPALTNETFRQLEAMTGSARTASGLQQLSAPSVCTSQARKP